MKRSTAIAILLLLTCLAPVYPVTAEIVEGSAAEHTRTAVRLPAPLQATWLYIDVEAKELRLSEGVTVEVMGRGSLQFRKGRRVIGFPDSLKVTVDGRAISSSQPVRSTGEVQLVNGNGESQWMLRRALSLPRSEGTRITDNDPEATAAIDTREETHFFLHVAGSGETTFFHPKESAAAERERPISPRLEPEGIARLGAALDTYFERLSRFDFSGSVLVAKGDAIVLADAYGLADRKERRPFTPSTVVTIGSITKPFTAAAILKLEEMGLLNVHDPIFTYLDGVPPDKRAITLHHLLTHTAGLKRNGLEGGDLNLEATRSAVLQDVLHSELVAPPGTSYRYSNVGYTLLAMIVEEVAQAPYERFVHEHLLIPARMYRTGYLIPNYEDGELAAGYRNGERLAPVIRLPMLDDGPTWNLRGNGGLHSDAYDMFRWFLALRSYDVLSTHSMQTMVMPHADQGDGEHFYGYGWEMNRTPRGTRDVFHSGGNGYFAAVFHWLPDEDYMFFVGSNAAEHVNMQRLSNIVEAILFDDPYALPPQVVALAPSLLQRYASDYRLASGAAFSVTARDSSLVLVAQNEAAVQAVLGGEDTIEGAAIRMLAERSRDILAKEFQGDFTPKYEAMGKTTPVETLKRYHDYDREAWAEAFGVFQNVEIVAAAGEGHEVQVVLRIDFEHGAAAERYTWRAGRLANISVIPDWSTFEFSRELFSVSETRFESFSTRSPLRLQVYFEREANAVSLVFPRLPDAPTAVRLRDN